MISVIMPLYNASKYLDEAIKSVLGQTFSDIELICVDDASTDSTSEIVLSWIESDGRIKLIHNASRLGAGESRNRGLDIAQGDYCIFLDGDDIFDETMLEMAHSCAVENDLDIVCFEFKHVNSDDIHNVITHEHGKYYVNSLCIEPFDIRKKQYCYLGFFKNNACDKLYKKSFLNKNRIQFQSLSCSNDVFFSQMSFICADRIMFLNTNKNMIYARRHTEVDRIGSNRDPMCVYYAYERLYSEASQHGLLTKCFPFILIRSFCSFCIVCETIRGKELYDYLKSSGVDTLKSLIGDNRLSLEYENKLGISLDMFKTKEYETGWFKYRKWETISLFRKDNAIWDLWNAYKSIVVWGAGYLGTVLVDSMKDKNLDIEFIIDSDPNKIGKQLQGFEIRRFSLEDIQGVDVIIVAVRGEFERIKSVIGNINIKVVNLVSTDYQVYLDIE